MTQENLTGTQVVSTQSTKMPAQAKKIDVLKTMLNAPSVMEQFKNALSKNASTFVASIIDLYNSDSNLQLCEPKAVVAECLKAAVLKLPINKALGYAFIIPFNNSKKVDDLDENGKPKIAQTVSLSKSISRLWSQRFNWGTRVIFSLRKDPINTVPLTQMSFLMVKFVK